MKYIPFILFTVMTNAAAQLMLKHGMMTLGDLSFAGANPILKILQIVFSPWIFAGLCVFVISMASHLYVLSKVDLSFAYPFLSLAYVAVAVFACLVMFLPVYLGTEDLVRRRELFSHRCYDVCTVAESVRHRRSA